MSKGQNIANGPVTGDKAQRDSGWSPVVRQVSHWDFTEGRLST